MGFQQLRDLDFTENTPLYENRWFLISISTTLLTAISFVATPYMVVATLAYALMCAGVLNRKNPWRHSRLMASAMITDVALVLILEIQRSAIKTTISFKLGPLQQIHIGSSLLAVLLYFPIAYLGYKKFQGTNSASSKKLHASLGKWAFVFRTIGFLFMFSLLAKSA